MTARSPISPVDQAAAPVLQTPTPVPQAPVRVRPAPVRLPVVRASVHALPRRAVALPVLAAAALVAGSWQALDHDSAAVLVLRGVAVLLATALAWTVDEPPAQLLDATPTPLRHRLAARLALCGALVVPAWLVAMATATSAGADVPVTMLTLELATLAVLGLTVPMALRRWWQNSEPALVTGPVLLGALLAAAHLPRSLVLLPGSPADPAWAAAHGRWALVLLVSAALLARALTDPATARVRTPVVPLRLLLRR